ncbi:MAG TPA: hypothetical protein VGM09_22950, partial [Bradyrhizobium sp.]
MSALCKEADLARPSRPPAKNFPLFFAGKSAAFGVRPVPNEGRIMIVIYAGWDAVDAAASSRVFLTRGRATLSRTAKSCGPD